MRKVQQFNSHNVLYMQSIGRCQLNGSTETLCLLKLPRRHCCRPVQPCLMMSHDPPPHTPPSFANLVILGCRAQMQHSDQFKPSYYQFDSTGLCRTQDSTKCKFTVYQIAVTWWMAQSW